MNSDGIKIESAKATEIKAGTEAKLESGLPFSAKGGTELKLEGGTQAELSSSAATKVAGGVADQLSERESCPQQSPSATPAPMAAPSSARRGDRADRRQAGRRDPATCIVCVLPLDGHQPTASLPERQHDGPHRRHAGPAHHRRLPGAPMAAVGQPTVLIWLRRHGRSCPRRLCLLPRHWLSFPPTFSGGGVVMTADEADIHASLQILFGTAPGERFPRTEIRPRPARTDVPNP